MILVNHFEKGTPLEYAVAYAVGLGEGVRQDVTFEYLGSSMCIPYRLTPLYRVVERFREIYERDQAKKETRMSDTFHPVAEALAASDRIMADLQERFPNLSKSQQYNFFRALSDVAKSVGSGVERRLE